MVLSRLGILIALNGVRLMFFITRWKIVTVGPPPMPPCWGLNAGSFVGQGLAFVWDGRCVEGCM